MTAVGGGNFSSPVTVSLKEVTDESGSLVVAITVSVNIVFIVILSLIVAIILVYTFWSVPQSIVCLSELVLFFPLQLN